MLKKFLPLVFISPIFFAGCASNKADPYIGNPPDYIYAKGHYDLQKGDYTDALAAYQSLDSQYPFENVTRQGDLDSIYAYYANNDPTMAVTAASRYIKIYPNDSNLDYAYYMMGVINFENGRGFLQKYMSYDMAEHNAPNYTNSFNNFATVITDFPNSVYAPDARRRMIFLNNTLAAYQMKVANMDYALKAYVAAANRAQSVILHYPTSPVRVQALKMMQKCHVALGLNDLAQSTQQVMDLNQPSST